MSALISKILESKFSNQNSILLEASADYESAKKNAEEASDVANSSEEHDDHHFAVASHLAAAKVAKNVKDKDYHINKAMEHHEAAV